MLGNNVSYMLALGWPIWQHGELSALIALCGCNAMDVSEIFRSGQ